ncbi:MAG: putative zinc-binding protein [Pirellulales bacterium]|nr:putative zinc-binding protein [Pirellulales bacterium]
MTEEPKKPCCACDAAPKLIFACSGAADVGQVSDLAARKLTAEGAGKMFCLAGIGGRVGGILETTKAAAAILAIDGCPLDCGRKTLEEAGFTRFEHLRLNDLGMEKGKTAATPDHVDQVVGRGRTRLAEAAGGA